jgi:hypothetical protein
MVKEKLSPIPLWPKTNILWPCKALSRASVCSDYNFVAIINDEIHDCIFGILDNNIHDLCICNTTMNIIYLLQLYL